MPNHDKHPFTIHITECRGLRGQFAWNVNRRGMRLRHSTRPYPDIDEARREAQAALAEAIAEWKVSQAIAVIPDGAGPEEPPEGA